MTTPKRKTSKARKNKRRSHHALSQMTVGACEHCGQPKLPHRICLYCGYYKGRVVIEGKE